MYNETITPVTTEPIVEQPVITEPIKEEAVVEEQIKEDKTELSLRDK